MLPLQFLLTNHVSFATSCHQNVYVIYGYNKNVLNVHILESIRAKNKFFIVLETKHFMSSKNNLSLIGQFDVITENLSCFSLFYYLFCLL